MRVFKPMSLVQALCSSLPFSSAVHSFYQAWFHKDYCNKFAKPNMSYLEMMACECMHSVSQGISNVTFFGDRGTRGQIVIQQYIYQCTFERDFRPHPYLWEEI